MDGLALAVSMLALLCSVLALVYTRRADRRAARVAERAKRAEIVVGGPPPDEEEDRFVVQLHVRNIGQAFARQGEVWLVDGEGNVASEAAWIPATVLEPNGPRRNTSLTGSLPLPPALRVHGSWTDDAGHHHDQPLGPWKHGS